MRIAIDIDSTLHRCFSVGTGQGVGVAAAK
jgi:hypothetical protein